MSDTTETEMHLSGENPDMGNERNATIIRTSVIGIAANMLLAGFKAVIGVVSNSICRMPPAPSSPSSEPGWQGKNRIGSIPSGMAGWNISPP